ncbi:MAG: flagellar basal body P-ring formation chaperone FlgA [Exilibacterium sp.]
MALRSFYAIFVLIALSGGSWASAFENLAALRAQTSEYLRQHYSESKRDQSETVTVTVGSLDPRLQLHKCDKPLTQQLTDRGSRGGNVTIKTRCTGTQPWSIFVTARVDIQAPIVIAGHSLSRHTLIREEDVELARRDTSTAGNGFVTDPARVVGKKLKRSLSPGAPIRLPLLEEPNAIKKGDAIVVEAARGTLTVVAPGTALTDGRIGQQIRVKNTHSERIIKARVVAPGRVRVML